MRGDKSFAYDLDVAPGGVSSRVALLLRSAEPKPERPRFVSLLSHHTTRLERGYGGDNEMGAAVSGHDGLVGPQAAQGQSPPGQGVLAGPSAPTHARPHVCMSGWLAGVPAKRPSFPGVAGAEAPPSSRSSIRRLHTRSKWAYCRRRSRRPAGSQPTRPVTA
jgi:hypothetical protein